MASRKSFFKGFEACGPPANHFLKGLAFPRSPKVVSRMVWSFRAWRKPFPEWFDISALGESRFPNGLEFPRLAKIISRMVWSFRGWRKSFPERFDVSAHGESVYNYLSIANILTKGLDRIELVEERELEPTP